MKKLILVFVTLLATTVACGSDDNKSSNSSCKPNATLQSETLSQYKNIEISSEQTIDFTNYRPWSEAATTTITLNTGESLVDIDVEIDSEEDKTLIDFENMVFIGEGIDGKPQSIPFQKDLTASSERGVDVYSLDEAAVRREMMKAEYKENFESDGVTMCSVSDANVGFELDEDAKTFVGRTKVVFEVRLSKEAMTGMRQYIESQQP